MEAREFSAPRKAMYLKESFTLGTEFCHEVIGINPHYESVVYCVLFIL